MVEDGGSMIVEFSHLDAVFEFMLYIASPILFGSSAPMLIEGPGFLKGQVPLLRGIRPKNFLTLGACLFTIWLITRRIHKTTHF
jgi:riboflavin biosynthesis pyrimidine reductase